MTIVYSRDLKETIARDRIATAADLRACLDFRPKIIDTARGQVECALRGDGPAVVIAHGGPGGCDQALILGELFRKSGYRIIAPSRPGYLGTPVDLGRTAEDQGDFLAALMDALDIPEALVLGVSGGGPAAYQLAQRRPEKARALVVIDGISRNYTKVDDINKFEEWMYLSRPGQWLIGFFFKHFPAAMVKNFLQMESTLNEHEMGDRIKEILEDEAKFAMFDAMFQTMSARFDQRRAGAENDIAMGSAIDELPLDRVACPTLIIHGDADNDVPPGDAEYAHQAIAGSTLLWINQASHIGFWTSADAYKVQRYTLDWLKNI